jgi:hypothetical protein
LAAVGGGLGIGLGSWVIQDWSVGTSVSRSAEKGGI